MYTQAVRLRRSTIILQVLQMEDIERPETPAKRYFKGPRIQALDTAYTPHGSAASFCSHGHQSAFCLTGWALQGDYGRPDSR
jgi:hypothetical protein